MATKDLEYSKNGLVNDHDLLQDKADVSHEEAMHIGALTEEEKVCNQAYSYAMPNAHLSQIIEKKLKRRIDSLIMPLVILVYLMNYIDRNNYAAARLQGLEEDLGLSASQYQLGLSILFVAYILAQVPSNLLLNHLGRPSLYLGFWTTAWGLVSACTSQVTNVGGIIACRFILG